MDIFLSHQLQQLADPGSSCRTISGMTKEIMSIARHSKTLLVDETATTL